MIAWLAVAAPLSRPSRHGGWCGLCGYADEVLNRLIRARSTPEGKAIEGRQFSQMPEPLAGYLPGRDIDLSQVRHPAKCLQAGVGHKRAGQPNRSESGKIEQGECPVCRVWREMEVLQQTQAVEVSDFVRLYNLASGKD